MPAGSLSEGKSKKVKAKAKSLIYFYFLLSPLAWWMQDAGCW